MERKDFIPEKFKFTKDLEGISLRTLQEHFKLYEGYVKKANEIQKKVTEADKSEANGVYSYIGELKRQETFAVNGMKLHEVYFGHLGGKGEPEGPLVKLIERDFGSLENWKEEMVATGLSARGWAILAFDFKDNRLHIYGSDAQNVGAVWGAAPLIAMDVYEHAYFIDYGTNRKDYVNAFFKNLDWEFANKIAKEFGLDKR
ncbi:MAG: superoxide dismutase, Fe-Mn family [Parcubacteria group bacterium Gr01-1014_19]|nr:MAG: superoxide dismutase, Fe-Mn family [Parcubacteria group bacterium Gr01-1014_19]